MSNNIIKSLLKINSQLLIVIGVSIFALLPILAPVFAHFGFTEVANIIYTVYQWFCHQRPWRSYHIFDYQIAYCAREVGTFSSIAVACFIVYKFKISPLRNWLLIVALLTVGALPMLIDGGIQFVAEIQAPNNISLLPFYESFDTTRSLTGILLGTTIAFIFFPYLSDVYNDESKANDVYKYDNWLASFVLSIIVSICLITLIVFTCYFTSNVYKPSSPFVDLTTRYPGYNYEIVTNGGHTPDPKFRFLVEGIDLYCRRAKIYLPNEFEKKCLLLSFL